MYAALRRPLRAAAAALAVALAAWACTDGTGPEGTLRLLFDTGTVTPGANVQLTALDAEGEVVWSTSDASVADVVSRTGWVTGVAPGTATITADDGASQVTATIQVRTPPILRVSSPTATLETVAGAGDPTPVSIQLTNDGDLPLTGLQIGDIVYGIGETGGWLTASLTGTTAPASLQLGAATAGLAPGTYTATLTVSSNVSANGPQSLAVTLRVLRPASIDLDRTQVELGTTPGQDSPPAQVQVSNGGDVPLTGLDVSVSYPGGGAAGWLDVDLSATSAPATLTLRARGATLAEGTYSAVVQVRSNLAGVATRSVQVDLVVAPGPAITLSAAAVSFTAVVAQADPPDQSVQITNGGGGTLNQLSLGPIQYAGTGGWLSASLTATTAPASVVFSVNAGALNPGTYTATVEVRSPVADNSPRTLTVTLVVDEAPVISVSPSSLVFSSVRGKGDPSAQALQITNIGGGVLSGLSVDVSYRAGASGWLDLNLTDPTAPTTLVAQARAVGLQVGVYVADLTISSNVPGVAPRTITVQYELKWSFQIDIQPFFTTTYAGFGFTPCTSCHFAGGNSPDLTTPNVAYQALINGGMVQPFNPGASSLYCKVSSGSGCGTAMPLPAAQVQRIRDWILQGAAY